LDIFRARRNVLRGSSTRIDPVFPVIVPTIGRPQLNITLRRLVLEPDVEVIVISDGFRPGGHEIAGCYRRVQFVTGPATGRWGNAQRMEGMRRARGRYLIFIDDDDVHAEDAFAHIRAAVIRNPDRVILFRMNVLGKILWSEPVVRHMNVGTPMMVVPNIPEKLGSWLTNDRYESDFDFLTECVALQGAPIWEEAIIAFAPQPAPLLARLRGWAAVRTRLGRLRGQLATPDAR
jgi:glycosyltransferase involved in cell wall biosynthesis